MTILLHWLLSPGEISVIINVGSVNKMLQNIALISKVLQECTGESVLHMRTPGMNSSKRKIRLHFSADTLCVGKADPVDKIPDSVTKKKRV